MTMLSFIAAFLVVSGVIGIIAGICGHVFFNWETRCDYDDAEKERLAKKVKMRPLFLLIHVASIVGGLWILIS